MNVKLWVLQILVLLLGCCHGKGETKSDLDIMKFIKKIEEKSPQGLASLVLHLPFKASPSSYLVIVRIHKKYEEKYEFFTIPSSNADVVVVVIKDLEFFPSLSKMSTMMTSTPLRSSIEMPLIFCNKLLVIMTLTCLLWDS